MAFSLTRSGVLARAAQLTNKGPARSALVSASSGAIGLAAGKSEHHKKKITIGAVAVGALANVVGLHGLGDGMMAGGATLIGYKLGAKKSGGVAPVSPAPGRRR